MYLSPRGLIVLSVGISYKKPMFNRANHWIINKSKNQKWAEIRYKERTGLLQEIDSSTLNSTTLPWERSSRKALLERSFGIETSEPCLRGMIYHKMQLIPTRFLTILDLKTVKIAMSSQKRFGFEGANVMWLFLNQILQSKILFIPSNLVEYSFEGWM